MNMTKEILKKLNTNTRKNISEVRVEEVHDTEEEKVFWRIYYTVNERKVILGESEINPQLARYKSNYL